MILVLAELHSNRDMGPELANRYIWWQVGSLPIYLTQYQKYKVCPELIYIKHTHRLCGKLHICYDLLLDQNVNDNAYSTSFIHEALDVDHKMAMMGIGWYHNIFSHICVQHQYYSEQFLLLDFFLYFPWSMTTCLRCSLDTFFGIFNLYWHHFCVCKNAL